MFVRQPSLVVSLVFLALAAGCDDKASPDKASPDKASPDKASPDKSSASAVATAAPTSSNAMARSSTSSGGTSSAASGGMTAMSAAASASASAAAMATPLTDDQIAQILVDINQGEIDQGKVAQKQATDPETKKLADTMVSEHTTWLKDGGDLFKKEKISPAKSDTATDLERDSKGLISRIATLKGADFDKAYVAAQVKNHQDALDLIDKTLMANVKDAELKNLLTTVRPKVAGHLEHCKKVLSGLGGAPDTSKASAPSPTSAPMKK